MQFFPNYCRINSAIWMHPKDANKHREKKLDGNYTRMLRALLNQSWRQHSTKQQVNGHLPLITKTIQTRRTRHAGHCWRSMDEFISDVLLWTPLHGRAKLGRPARTYIQQLCADTGCELEDLPEAMDEKRPGISVFAARHHDDDRWFKFRVFFSYIGHWTKAKEISLLYP